MRWHLKRTLKSSGRKNEKKRIFAEHINEIKFVENDFAMGQQLVAGGNSLTRAIKRLNMRADFWLSESTLTTASGQFWQLLVSWHLITQLPTAPRALPRCPDQFRFESQSKALRTALNEHIRLVADPCCQSHPHPTAAHVLALHCFIALYIQVATLHNTLTLMFISLQLGQF